MADSGTLRLKLSKATQSGKPVNFNKPTTPAGDALGQMISSKLKVGLGSRSAQNRINSSISKSSKIVRGY